MFDLLNRLREGWRWITGGLAFGVLVAVAAIAISVPKFEAVAFLQTGKVAGAPIEDTATVLERLKTPAFQLETAREVEDLVWFEAIQLGVIGSVLTAQIPKATPGLIEVKVRANTPEKAKIIASVVTTRLIDRQNALSSQVVAKIKFDISVLKEKLLKSESDLALLSKTVSSANIRNENFSQSVLLMSLRMQKESDTFSLRQSIYSQENSLLPPLSQPARVLEDIFVSQRAVSPKKTLLLALGLMGGLLAGVVLVFVRGAWWQARDRRSASESPS